MSSRAKRLVDAAINCVRSNNESNESDENPNLKDQNQGMLQKF